MNPATAPNLTAAMVAQARAAAGAPSLVRRLQAVAGWSAADTLAALGAHFGRS